MLSRQTDGFSERFSPGARLLNLSERMEQEMGRVPTAVTAWGDRSALRQRLLITPHPSVIWLASSGPNKRFGANSIRCSRRLSMWTIAVSRVQKGLAIAGSCSANLNPSRILRCKAFGCCCCACHEEWSTGLWVDQQF